MRTRRSRVVRRRRQTLERLVLAAGLTLILGLVPALRALLVLHLVLDVAIAGYVLQLRRWAQEERAARQRARRMATAPAASIASEPAFPGDVEEDEFPTAFRRSG